MFERYAKKTFLDIVRDFTSFGNQLILLIVAFLVVGLGSMFWKLVIGLIVLEIVGSIIKLVHFKVRPRKEVYANMAEKIDAGSFPSLHTARSTFVFLTLFALTQDYILKCLLIVLIVVVAFTRIKLKKHYLIDVIVGFLLGAVFSWALLNI